MKLFMKFFDKSGIDRSHIVHIDPTTGMIDNAQPEIIIETAYDPTTDTTVVIPPDFNSTINSILLNNKE